MKVPPKNIDGFVKKPPPETVAVLLYGPDEGLIRERMNVLTKNIVPDIQDPFGVAEFSGPVLEDDPARLMDEAMSISMLGGRRVVRVRDASDKITAAVKDTLAVLRPGENFVVLAAGELSPRSTLRLLFESAGGTGPDASGIAAAIPCYVDDERDIGRVIGDALRSAGYTASPDAVATMAANVVGDRAVARSEVEKLITYIGDRQKNVAVEDVIACVGNSAALSLDDLAKNVASGRFAEADRILGHVLSEGLPPVTVLRNLQSYFMRLHITKSRVQKGESLEEALRKLRPPLFFKVKPAFESQVSNWGTGQMEQALMLLAGVEAKCKQTASDPHILCSRAVLSLSQIGARVLRARA